MNDQAYWQEVVNAVARQRDTALNAVAMLEARVASLMKELAAKSEHASSEVARSADGGNN